MKIIVTHYSADLDGITAIWLIKKFLPGWEKARIKFVPAGERLKKLEVRSKKLEVIERIGDNEVIHIDTGLGPLDHHQTESNSVSAASLTWDFIKKQFEKNGQKITKEHQEAISRIVKIVTDIDHFKEVLWAEPGADYHEFSLSAILEGFKHQFPNKEKMRVDFIIKCLEALFHQFENRVWAEQELKKGIEFKVGGERGIGFETVNDAVLPLAQKRGFGIVLRKDPRKGYLRIKVRPDKNFDLTPVYEKLKKLDRTATWFLHISKKMLLNGTGKNPKMKPTKLGLKEIIEVLKKTYG